MTRTSSTATTTASRPSPPRVSRKPVRLSRPGATCPAPPPAQRDASQPTSGDEIRLSQRLGSLTTQRLTPILCFPGGNGDSRFHQPAGQERLRGPRERGSGPPCGMAIGHRWFGQGGRDRGGPGHREDRPGRDAAGQHSRTGGPGGRGQRRIEVPVANP